MTGALLTTGETAEALRVSTQTVLRYLEAGELAGVRLPGGQWRVYRSSVHDLLRTSPAPVEEVR